LVDLSARKYRRYHFAAFVVACGTVLKKEPKHMKSTFIFALSIILTINAAMRAQEYVAPAAAAVPTTVAPAPEVDFPIPQPPQPVAVQNPPQVKSAASIQLEKKLAELDQLQREIDELRHQTQTCPQILVSIQAVEVNLTKAQQSKFDVSAFTAASGIAISDTPNNPNQQAVQSDRDQKALLKKLTQNNLARVIASPTLVVLSGSPATFNVGGEFPVPSAQLNGVEFREFGTKVDLLAESLGNNKVRIHVRPRISELDEKHQIVVNGVKVPGLSVRQCDFTSELTFGQTVILSGLVDRDMSGEGAKKGEPVETMLAFVVTPEAVGATLPSPPTLHRIGNRLFAPVPTK
jgi:hypothetical protein